MSLLVDFFIRTVHEFTASKAVPILCAISSFVTYGYVMKDDMPVNLSKELAKLYIKGIVALNAASVGLGFLRTRPDYLFPVTSAFGHILIYLGTLVVVHASQYLYKRRVVRK